MRYGVVILPEHGFAQSQQVWRYAEELGFDSAWTYDHCIWRWLAGRRGSRGMWGAGLAVCGWRGRGSRMWPGWPS